MAVPPQVSSDSLPVSVLLVIDKICRQFEAELEGGKQPQIDAFLGHTPEPQRNELRRVRRNWRRARRRESTRTRGDTPEPPQARSPTICMLVSWGLRTLSLLRFLHREMP